MTENQLFPMSADLFDTSSNSSNPLKFDLYASLGLNSNSNSSSVSGLFCSSASLLPTLSQSPQLTIVTTSPILSTALTPASSANSGSVSSNNSGVSIGGGTGPSNVMLTTNAISIPRSNNSNQNHHHHHHHHHHHQNNDHHNNSHHNNQLSSSYRDNSLLMQHHHPNPSPLQQPNMMTQHQQQQQLQRQSQLQQQQQHQQQHQQQQHQAQSPPTISDLSEYGLDALDASSLSPTLLQDVNLGAATTLHNNSNSVTPTITASGNSVGSFYNQDISQSSGANSCIITSDNQTLLSLNATLVDDVNNPLLYEVTPNSNTLWSDIGSAIVTTKNEPFTLEEDYIFPIDKTGAGFPEISDEHFLEDFGNLEEFLPITTVSPATAVSSGSGFMLSPQSNSSLHQLGSPQASPGGPPLELLQLQQQQLTQLQSLQSSQPYSTSSGSSNAGSGGGAIHHTHHNHHSSSSPYDIYHSTPNKQHQQQQQQQQQHQQQQQQQQHQLHSNSSASNTFSPGSQPSHSPLQQLNNSSITPPPPPRAPQYQHGPHVKSRNMQELMKKGFSMSPDRSSALLGQSVPGSQMLISGNALSPGSGSSGFGSTTGGSTSGSARKSFGYQNDASSSRLSSSAPTHLGLEQIWMRREPRQHLLSTGSLAEAESYSSLSTGSVLSPEGVDLSQDDDDDASTDFNSDHYDDFSSDGSDNEDDNRTSTPNLSSSKGKERFFWQYNVQAKGPKGKRLVFQSKIEDPHHLNEVTDPVFSPNCSVRGIKVYKHSGKARKGDGNDLTPNPRKLHNIGKELDKLSRTINDMTPVSELPFNVRPKSRKEKNKLASRACRLKKKAQHEANKIKLYGLEIEHKRLLNGIAELKQALAIKYLNSNEPKEEIDQKIETIYQATSSGIRIAGGTTDFVNKVLENVRAGAPNGGLEELRNS